MALMDELGWEAGIRTSGRNGSLASSSRCVALGFPQPVGQAVPSGGNLGRRTVIARRPLTILAAIRG